MHAGQHPTRIQTIELPGRRRWLIWGEREQEFHLQFLASGDTTAAQVRTVCGRPVDPECRSVIAPDPSICPHCAEAARSWARARLPDPGTVDRVS